MNKLKSTFLTGGALLMLAGCGTITPVASVPTDTSVAQPAVVYAPVQAVAPTPAPTAAPTPPAPPCPGGFHNGTPGDTYSGCYADPTPTPVPTATYLYNPTPDCIIHITDLDTLDGMYASVSDNALVGSLATSPAAQNLCDNLVTAANDAPGGHTASAPSWDEQTHGIVVCHYAVFYQGTTLSVTARRDVGSNAGWAQAFCNAKLN